MKSIVRLCSLGVMLVVFSAASSAVYADSGADKQKAVLVTGATTDTLKSCSKFPLHPIGAVAVLEF